MAEEKRNSVLILFGDKAEPIKDKVVSFVKATDLNPFTYKDMPTNRTLNDKEEELFNRAQFSIFLVHEENNSSTSPNLIAELAIYDQKYYQDMGSIILKEKNVNIGSILKSSNVWKEIDEFDTGFENGLDAARDILLSLKEKDMFLNMYSIIEHKEYLGRYVELINLIESLRTLKKSIPKLDPSTIVQQIADEIRKSFEENIEARTE